MKNTFGNNLSITLFGESHGSHIGCVLDGLTPGLTIDEDFINHQLDLRRPYGKISTQRVETDEFQIISGVFEGRTTGTPLTIIVPNQIQHSKDYSQLQNVMRPGHADYTANCKFHGFQDYRGGGHFSGRVTVALVAAGAIVMSALLKSGIFIGSHILSCGGIKDNQFANDTVTLINQINQMNESIFAVLDQNIASEMQAKIQEIASLGDSVGGVLETAVVGLPSGLGEPWFDSIESLLSHGLFSIPGIKGVQFGAGFDMVNDLGSNFNDSFTISDSSVTTCTNNNGGINGGITNGMPILFRCGVKPTPSIYKKQQTIDISKNENVELQIQGRHDPAIIHRARVVVDSITALVLFDILVGRFGTDFFTNKE